MKSVDQVWDQEARKQKAGMTQLFGHERLDVYKKGMAFAVLRRALLDNLRRQVSACDHLERGAESILVNIAHARSSWTPKDRLIYLGHANGSALECAACLDILVVKNLLPADDILAGKSLLGEIVSILVTMRKTTAGRVREDHAVYRTRKGNRFSHEDLDVYQASLQFVGWLEDMTAEFSCSADILSKLDKSTTATVLNIAEGNGRFTGFDKTRFFGIAYRATVQSASLIDLAAINTSATSSRIDDGRELLRRVAAMLRSLSRSVTNDS